MTNWQWFRLVFRMAAAMQLAAVALYAATFVVHGISTPALGFSAWRIAASFTPSALFYVLLFWCPPFLCRWAMRDERPIAAESTPFDPAWAKPFFAFAAALYFSQYVVLDVGGLLDIAVRALTDNAFLEGIDLPSPAEIAAWTVFHLIVAVVLYRNAQTFARLVPGSAEPEMHHDE